MPIVQSNTGSVYTRTLSVSVDFGEAVKLSFAPAAAIKTHHPKRSEAERQYALKPTHCLCLLFLVSILVASSAVVTVSPNKETTWKKAWKARAPAQLADEAFLAGMMMQLGRLLTEFYFPEEAALVRRRLEPLAQRTVDVSHASDRAVADVLALAAETAGVVVATHSNARALCEHPRNLTDQQLRGIAATGGVVGLNFHSPFVVRGRPAELSDVVRQARHLVEVAGEDHVAIGADYEGGIRPARGLAGAAQFPELARALLRAGLPARAVTKLFSENALRVLCRSGN